VRTEREDVAKGYHVLAGFLRDLRNARGDAADGSATAGELLDQLDDELELLYERSDGELPLGQEGDDAACVNEDDDGEESESDTLLRDEPKAGPLGSVGAHGGGTSKRVSSSNGGRRQLRLPEPRSIQRETLGCGEFKTHKA